MVGSGVERLTVELSGRQWGREVDSGVEWSAVGLRG